MALPSPSDYPAATGFSLATVMSAATALLLHFNIPKDVLEQIGIIVAAVMPFIGTIVHYKVTPVKNLVAQAEPVAKEVAAVATQVAAVADALTTNTTA